MMSKEEAGELELELEEVQFLLQLLHNERERYNFCDHDLADYVRVTIDELAEKLARITYGKDAKDEGESVREKDSEPSP